MFENHRTIWAKKYLLQKILYRIHNFLVYSAAELLSFSFAGDQARVLQLFEVMRDRGARELHAGADFRKGALDGTAGGFFGGDYHVLFRLFPVLIDNQEYL